jgi:hypothetical protein
MIWLFRRDGDGTGLTPGENLPERLETRVFFCNDPYWFETRTECRLKVHKADPA